MTADSECAVAMKVATKSNNAAQCMRYKLQRTSLPPTNMYIGRGATTYPFLLIAQHPVSDEEVQPNRLLLLVPFQGSRVDGSNVQES